MNELYSRNDNFANQLELMGDMKENLVEYIHTKDGAKVANICISIAPPKVSDDVICTAPSFLVT
jgi:hypothetical protein